MTPSSLVERLGPVLWVGLLLGAFLGVLLCLAEWSRPAEDRTAVAGTAFVFFLCLVVIGWAAFDLIGEHLS